MTSDVQPPRSASTSGVSARIARFGSAETDRASSSTSEQDAGACRTGRDRFLRRGFDSSRSDLTTPPLWLVHNDDAVVPWYDGWRPSRKEAEDTARHIAESWRLHDVHKWIAYDRETEDVIGRGGLSRTPIDDDWGQLYALLPNEPWIRTAHANELPFRAHKHWLETGWALRSAYWGRGYASEIGAASLAYAFDVVGVRAVVSCTVRLNMGSRAVMEHIGMHYAGEIRSRGIVEGERDVQADAPFAVYRLLATDHRP